MFKELKSAPHPNDTCSSMSFFVRQPQHTTTNNQHELPPPYTPSPLALHCYGNALHGPKSQLRGSLWAYERHPVLGLRSQLSVPMFGAPKRDPSKNREMDGALALGGHQLIKIPNNQLIVGGKGQGRSLSRGTWAGEQVGGHHPIVWGNDSNKEQ